MAAKSRRPKADHYNTGEIVLRLSRQRRRAVLIGCLLAGAVVAAISTFLYLQSKEPTLAHPPAKDAAVKPRAPLPKSSPPPTPPAPPARSQKAHLSITLSKNAPLWIDGKPLGVKQHFDVDVEPGNYELKARFGRRFATLRVSVEEQATLSIHFDSRRKSGVVRSH